MAAENRKLFGLDSMVEPSAILGSLVLFVVLCGLAIAWLGLDVLPALVFGILCVALHWLADTWHQLGHARAARQTGYPMIGIRFGTMALLSTAIYPRDEPALPARVHIHRALGGPKASAVLALLSAILVILLRGNTTLGDAAWFFFLDNLLMFTLGSFFPLGFTDGSTILHWRNRP